MKPWYYDRDSAPPSDIVSWDGKPREEDRWFIRQATRIGVCRCGMATIGAKTPEGISHNEHACAKTVVSITGRRRVA